MPDPVSTQTALDLSTLIGGGMGTAGGAAILYLLKTISDKVDIAVSVQRQILETFAAHCKTEQSSAERIASSIQSLSEHSERIERLTERMVLK